MINITAIICARNEGVYLKHSLQYLEEQEIEVVLVNNGDDDNYLQSKDFKKLTNIVSVVEFPYHGYFDLSKQLEIKEQIVEKLNTNWIIHQDSDEILHAQETWGGLRDSIADEDAKGFNVLNFNELVMLPLNPDIDDILENNRLCYLFEPKPLRLMRAWKKDAYLSNNNHGGHMLEGNNINISPKKMILKHFIVRTQKHAFSKYLNRLFSDSDIKRGWHGNRRNFTLDNLKIPYNSKRLLLLDNPKVVPIKMPPPQIKHFWEWGEDLS